MPIVSSRTPRAETYAEVYAQVYALAPGAMISSAEILDALAALPEHAATIAHATVWRALANAEAVRLVERKAVPRPRGTPSLRWVRLAWPEVVHVDWLRRRGATLEIAAAVLDSLEASGYLAGADDGFRRAP